MSLNRSLQQCFFSRAQLLIRQSRFDLAERELRLGISQDPEDGSMFGMLGVCLAAQKKPIEAMEYVDRAIQLQPEDFYAYFARAYVLHQQGRWPQASDSTDEAI